jgi:hypothetical protein
MSKRFFIGLIILSLLALYLITVNPISNHTVSAAAYLVSQGQPANAGTIGSGTPVAAGNDGDTTTTRWGADSSSFPQWWRVDLGSSMSLNQVDLKWYKATTRAYKYKIETSGDDSAYTTVVDKTGNTTIGDTSDTFTATGRYVRITVTGCSDTAAWASFYECQVYSPNAPGPTATPVPTPTPPSGLKNLAFRRAAYQSSYANFNDTGHLATDGFNKAQTGYSSKWVSGSGDPQWIYVDLGIASNISVVRLYWDTDYAKSYKIQTSNDAAAWSDVYSTTAGDGGLDEISFTATAARYARIYCTQKGTAGSSYSLFELEVYGTGGLTYTAAPTPTPNPDGSLFLRGGNWKLQRAAQVTATSAQISTAGFDAGSWVIATVPGTVLASYLNIGAIPDPNYSDQQVQISESFFTTDFWYRDEFTVPSSYSGNKVWLNFDGINWKAEVYVNGTYVGRIDGLARGKFDVTSLVTVGATNALAVKIYKNNNPGAVTLQSLHNPGGNGGVLGTDSPTFVCSMGWNWIPTIRGRNIGIWDDVWLSKTGNVSIIDPFIKTDLPLPNTTPADLAIKVDLKNNMASAQSGTLSGTINPGNITFQQAVSLNASETKTVTLDKTTFAQLSISNPNLWWPNGYGPQNLYTLTLDYKINATVSDIKTLTFGIRELSYNDTTSNLSINVNGQKVVVRGGNWGMDDGMKIYDPAFFDLRLRLHKEMNMNLIRNWVSQTCDEDFYNACDKYGILIWDDFWLANPGDGPDPGDNNLFLANSQDKVKRFRNHPSIALWCGRNEGNPPAVIDTGLRDYTTNLDGTRFYISHSASTPVSGFGPYSIMDEKWYYANRGTSLHSELGLVCPPPVESFQAMMPADKLWPINDMWGVHDWTQSRCDDFINMMNSNYGSATGLDDFCRKSAMILTQNVKPMFEAWQSKRGGGVVLWMSHPSWPSLICQTYDYYMEPTAAYFAIKKACEPVHILWRPDNEQIQVANNTAQDLNNATAEAYVYNMDGTLKYSNSVPVNALKNSTTTCFTISYPGGLSNVHFLKLKFKNSGGTLLSDNFYWRGTTYDNYTDLANMSKLTLSGSATKSTNGTTCTITANISNNSSNIAVMTRLKVLRDLSGKRVLPAFYSDNYLSLLPNETKTVTVEFDTANLAGEQPKLMVEGWNVNSSQITISSGGSTPTPLPTATPTLTPTPTPVVTPTPTPTPGSGIVNLSGSYNQDAYSYDSSRTDGSYDGNGSTYSADLVNTTPVFEGVSYQLGPLTNGVNNAINGTGQVINLTQGQYASIRLLGSGTNNDQTGTFRITYSDSTYTDVSVTQFDWRTSNSVAGEKVVQTMDHKHMPTGDSTIKNTYIFAYYLTPTAGKMVKSLTLPNNTNMHVLAITLVP